MTSFIFPYYFPKQQLRIVQSVKEKKEGENHESFTSF